MVQIRNPRPPSFVTHHPSPITHHPHLSVCITLDPCWGYKATDIHFRGRIRWTWSWIWRSWNWKDSLFTWKSELIDEESLSCSAPFRERRERQLLIRQVDTRTRLSVTESSRRLFSSFPAWEHCRLVLTDAIIADGNEPRVVGATKRMAPNSATRASPSPQKDYEFAGKWQA